MFRYARTAFGLYILPLDLLLMFAKNVATWLSRVVAPEWLKAKINALMEFVLMEIEHQKSRYSRFSCLLPTSDVAYSKPKIPEIELSEDARKELAMIRESDRRRRASSELPQAAASVSSNLSKDWSSGDTGDDADSFQHVIEYSKNHDAMYQFHYFDENNRMRKFELFNMAEPYKRHECHSNISDNVQPLHPMLVEEKEHEGATGCCSKTDEADSGLSGVEGQMDTGRRDACCSPVRYFPPPSRASGRSKPSRRHCSAAGSSGQTLTGRKQHPVSRSGSVVSGSRVGGARSADSDSDGDGADKLFLPARRQRTSSAEYDGEPEPSDTEITV